MTTTVLWLSPVIEPLPQLVEAVIVEVIKDKLMNQKRNAAGTNLTDKDG